MKHLYLELSPEIERDYDVDVNLRENFALIKKNGRMIKRITLIHNEDGFHYEYKKNFVVIKKCVDGSFGGIESTGKFKPYTVKEKEMLIKWAILEKMQLLLNKKSSSRPKIKL